MRLSTFIHSRLYKVLGGLYVFFMLVVIVFSADIFSPYHCFTNKSDSMAPVITTGSMTIVRSFPSYEVGDMISYYSNDTGVEEIVTHRVTAIGGNVYLTKGDANNVADRVLVVPRLILGKVIYIIPYLGYVITFTKGTIGTALLILLPAFLLIVSELAWIFFEVRKEKEVG